MKPTFAAAALLARTLGPMPSRAQQVTTLIQFTNLWKFDQSGRDLGTAWRTNDYDDSAWTLGPGLLGNEDNQPPYRIHAPINTQLTVSTAVTTFYFRATFNFAGPTNGLNLVATNLVDDGCVIYLNGLSTGGVRAPAAYNATTAFQGPATEGQLDLVTFTNVSALRLGKNLLAVEVHQSGSFSADVLQTGQEELISISVTGTNGNGSSSTPLISHDARVVVFASKASNLVSNDNNRVTDIFVRDRFAGVTHCVSRNFAGTGTGNRVSSNPILSADGRTVAFQSFASDLVPGDYNDTRDVFVVTLGGPDTDGDHMDDDWEMAYFNTLSRDGSGDFDNDGASDLDEFRTGTNPANDASILRLLTMTTSIAAGPEPRRTTVLLWSAIPGKTYRVQFKASFDVPWAAVGADVTAGSTSASLTDTVEATDEPNNPHRFYRVLLVQ